MGKIILLLLATLFNFQIGIAQDQGLVTSEQIDTLEVGDLIQVVLENIAFENSNNNKTEIGFFKKLPVEKKCFMLWWF